eukprot:TRINITY_DN383_c3_g1_i1.p1 TRINITY_DN383_c3_g1~~TRINITY_DN383_c3_g1_i1.p1  ORF type:complete len:297 (+),score=29.11 TRINITY_DN383_c3_g1_i1:132-1022(+)
MISKFLISFLLFGLCFCEVFELEQNPELKNPEKLPKNREFGLFVLYTARPSKYGCSVCATTEKEYNLVSECYNEVKMPNDPILRFAVADFEANTKLFQKYNFKAVPILAYYNQSSDGSLNSNNMVISYEGETAESVSSFILEQTGMEVTISRSPMPKILFSLIVLMAVCLGGYYVFIHPEIIIRFRNAKSVWLCGSLIVFFISVSGVVFDILRGAPPYSIDSRGFIQFFSPQSNHQFVFEGLWTGLIYFALGGLMLFVMKRKTNGSIWIALLVLFILFSHLYNNYKRKNGWYAPFG